MINDLEAAIARHHPEIDQMKAALRRAGALAAAMSGSGSAVFGLFQKRRDATRAVERLSGSGWRVVLTESLGRDEYAKVSRPVPGRIGRAIANHSGTRSAQVMEDRSSPCPCDSVVVAILPMTGSLD